jgi:hypothetical protein
MGTKTSRETNPLSLGFITPCNNEKMFETSFVVKFSENSVNLSVS